MKKHSDKFQLPETGCCYYVQISINWEQMLPGQSQMHFIYFDTYTSIYTVSALEYV